MADYDVGVVALTTPASVAPLAASRPVVSVRNNGLFDTVASGYIRIYSAGLLIFESEIYSDTLSPGQTGPASALAYWTPPAEGFYIVQGYASCPLDQNEPNNNLFPVTIEVRESAPVPPETPVPIHASQHESGGEDELSIEGLPGRAQDAQLPVTHASNHEAAGIDAIDVTGLPGVLGQAQNAKAHAASHKVGGSDVVDVLGLPNATALELVARKGIANGYAPLDEYHVVPMEDLIIASDVCEPDEEEDARGIRQDRHLGQVNPVPHAATHGPGGRDPVSALSTVTATAAAVDCSQGGGQQTLVQITVPARLMTSSFGLLFRSAGDITFLPATGQKLHLKLYQAGYLIQDFSLDLNISGLATYVLEALIAATDAQHVKHYLSLYTASAAPACKLTEIGPWPNADAISAQETTYALAVAWENANAGTLFSQSIGHAHTTNG
jgi:hypothetical protein